MYKFLSSRTLAMKWRYGVEPSDSAVLAFAENRYGASLPVASAASDKRLLWSGASRCSNTVASRLFQFLCAFQKVFLYSTPDEFRHWSTRFLDTVFLSYESDEGSIGGRFL